MFAKRIHKIGLWGKLLITALRSKSNQEFYDGISDFYDELFVEHNQHAKKIVELLEQKFLGRENEINVLDLGCGTGVLSAALSEKGFNVVGVDISLCSLRQLQKYYPDINVINADVSYLPVREGCCQVVVSLGAWRHFPDVQQVMKELVNSLTEDSILIIGYFPPSYAGVFHQSSGYIDKLVTNFYQWILAKRGYTDIVSPLLESETVVLVEGYFDSVTKIMSGERWRLIMAQHLRKPRCVY